MKAGAFRDVAGVSSTERAANHGEGREMGPTRVTGAVWQTRPNAGLRSVNFNRQAVEKLGRFLMQRGDSAAMFDK